MPRRSFTEPKIAAARSAHALLPSLVALSHRIHARPELAFEEEKSAGWLAELLDQSGFTVQTGLCGLPTAIAAHRGSGPLRIVFCAEYDALSGMGHACGHNMIAAMAAGAALALGELVDDLGVTVTVMGTPAEEIGNGGGKILLLERGAFAGAHAAMMVHPGTHDSVKTGYLAASTSTIEYVGRASHASVSPQFGVNAADALTVAQVAIGLLRQHIGRSDRIHGIVTHGGDAPNVIPAHTSASYMVRAASIAELKGLTSRVHSCFKAGATATGCNLRITGGDKPYAEMHQDADLSRLYKRNAESLGRHFVDNGLTADSAASTDMGNVSCIIPSIHPSIGINSFPALNHQLEFAAHCITATADQAVHDGALAMAWTVIDVARDETLRNRLLATHSHSKSVEASGTP
jgi:amidohydrolase